VAAAKGKYILPLDADDMIAPEFLEKTVNLLESRPDLGFVSTKALFFGDKNQIWPREQFNSSNLIITNQQGNTTLYRKEMWADVGGYTEAMLNGYMDWEFWIKCFKHGWTGEQIDEPLYLYRRKNDSVVMRAKKSDVQIKTQIMQLHPEIYNVSKIDPNDPELHKKNWIPPRLIRQNFKIKRKISSDIDNKDINTNKSNGQKDVSPSSQAVSQILKALSHYLPEFNAIFLSPEAGQGDPATFEPFFKQFTRKTEHFLNQGNHEKALKQAALLVASYPLEKKAALYFINVSAKSGSINSAYQLCKLYSYIFPDDQDILVFMAELLKLR
jgi:glycosyltransferase involved in cell wall biosynthesis